MDASGSDAAAAGATGGGDPALLGTRIADGSGKTLVPIASKGGAMLSIPVKAGGTPRGSGPRSHRDSPTDATKDGPRRGWFGFKSKRKMDDYSNVRTQWEGLGGDGVSVLPENQPRSRYAQDYGAKAAAARLAYREKAAKARAAAAAERERARAEAREKYEATRQQQEQQQATQPSAASAAEGDEEQPVLYSKGGGGSSSQPQQWDGEGEPPLSEDLGAEEVYDDTCLGGLVRCLSGGGGGFGSVPPPPGSPTAALFTPGRVRSRSPVRSPNVWVRSPDGATWMRSKALPDGWVSVADPATGEIYYWHRPSGETTWIKPMHGDGLSDIFEADDEAEEGSPLPRQGRSGSRGGLQRARPRSRAMPNTTRRSRASKRSHAAARRASWPPPRPRRARTRMACARPWDGRLRSCCRAAAVPRRRRPPPTTVRSTSRASHRHAACLRAAAAAARRVVAVGRRRRRASSAPTLP